MRRDFPVALALAVAICALGFAALADGANTSVKKFAVSTTVEEELGPDGKPTGYLTGKVTSKYPWCTRHAGVNIGSAPEDTGFGAVTETNGKGVWKALPGELAGRRVVVIVKPPGGYPPKVSPHTRAVCKSTRANATF
jgi:hypothetical protein